VNLKEKKDFLFDERQVVLHRQRRVNEKIDHVLDDCTEYLATTTLQPVDTATSRNVTSRNESLTPPADRSVHR